MAANEGAAGARSALIVANYDYADPGLGQLHAPANDARALEAVLRNPAIGGFEVRTLLNEPAHEVSLAVEEFFADRRASDLLLMHFSCHGVKDEGGDLYFATSNTQLRALGATAVGAAFVNRCMNRSRSRRIVLLLDCCYAGAFERGMTARAGSGVGIEAQFGGRGRAVITASSAMEYAFEGETLADTREAAPSVFTSALVKGLETGEADRDQDGLVALDELYDYIYDTVRAVTPHQTPGKWTFGVQGELVIARRSQPVTTPAQLPREVQEAIDSPLAAVRAAAVQELARLMTARHAGVALAARLALERFTSDDSRTVATAAAAALESQVPAGIASPPGTPATALGTAGETATAPTETGSPPPNAVTSPAEPEIQPPAAPPVPTEARADADAPPAVSGPLEDTASTPAAAVPASVPPAPHAEAVPAPGGREDQAPDEAPAGGGRPAAATGGLRRGAGVLAITAAILSIAGLFPTFATVPQGSYSLADLTFTKWYVILGAVVDLVAGAGMFAPATRRLIAPGFLLGNVAVSSGALVFLIASGQAGTGAGYGLGLQLVSVLSEIAAACLAGVAVARTPEIRLTRWPARAEFAWIVILLGAVAAAALVAYSQRLAVADLSTYLTITIWTAVAALIVPLIATSAVPARFAVALLGGWLAANLATFVYFILFLGYENANGVHVNPVPVVVFGLAIGALLITVALFARAAARREA
jgi:hypothetical protein